VSVKSQILRQHEHEERKRSWVNRQTRRDQAAPSYERNSTLDNLETGKPQPWADANEVERYPVPSYSKTKWGIQVLERSG